MRASWRRSTPTGGRPTTSRSARSISSTTRCCGSRCAPSTSSRACSATGARRPGLNLVYAHLNRVIRAARPRRDLRRRPGTRRTGAWSPTPTSRARTREVYPRDHPRRGGHARACSASSRFPGGIPSHVAPETPGSIHEGGELGYALVHAYGAAFDNPDLVVACVVGDGEAETGPLAASWHSNKFLNPARDGAVLPILHLNGYKIANPTVLARIPDEELDRRSSRATATRRTIVAGDDPDDGAPGASRRPSTRSLDEIAAIQRDARASGTSGTRPRWPMIVLRTPKGWTGPAEVDGQPVEGTWRSHQVPLADVRDNPAHLASARGLAALATGPTSCSTRRARCAPELAGLRAAGDRRMSANPHANGGSLLRDLALPGLPRRTPSTCRRPAPRSAEATRVLGTFLRDVIDAQSAATFRIFGPDETASNRLDAVFEATDTAWMAETLPVDEHLAPDGRVMEVLSEHLCQGWLEGYLLTGRHGLFNCYEAFIHIVDSMFNQHAKWLKVDARASRGGGRSRR